jgi:RecB family exonuclease
MHNALYEFLKNTWRSKPTFAKLQDAYKQQWIDQGFYDAKEKQDYFRLGKKSLKYFWDNYRKTKPQILEINGQPALELGFNLKINGCTIRGKIDRIDKTRQGIEIIDYKTGAVKERLRPEDKQQLLIYQIAAAEVLGLEPALLSYLYLETGTRASFLGSQKEVEAQKENIIGQIEKIKNSDFRAKPGWQCAWCDYKNICEFARK